MWKAVSLGPRDSSSGMQVEPWSLDVENQKTKQEQNLWSVTIGKLLKTVTISSYWPKKKYCMNVNLNLIYN